MTEREQTYRKTIICYLILSSIPSEHENDAVNIGAARNNLYLAMKEAAVKGYQGDLQGSISDTVEYQEIARLLEI